MRPGQLPSGTVTFLFTDIEGSSKLWEAHPEAMREALTRHDVLMREAIESSRGHVFRTQGDAFCATFTTAADAVSALVSAQVALASESWPETTPIKVRIALHTGVAEIRDGDYFGACVNRVARLLSAGHGGQALLSQTTFDLARDALANGAQLREMGEHQLKDLGRPEYVYQLVLPGLRSEFPPLRTLDNPEMKHNLPGQLTSFIGRDKELAEVASLFAKTRLLTLTGSGGCGKTRLALQVAADMLDGSGDGVWLVELAPITDHVLVPQAVADALNVKEQPGKSVTQSLVERFKRQNLLLVLDNCEHVLDACASLADVLLRNCQRVLILATSRESLNVAGETAYRVPSLSLPDPKQAQTPESLSHFESVLLFIDRAVQVQTSFLVTNQNAPALASVCYRLDGIPLAIELAAARVRSLSVEDIDGKLDERFRLLTRGSRTAVPRQQTLRGAIDWSYDLLSEQERRLLARLSVFSGGWTLDAAEKVCAGGDVFEWEMLDLLASLVDKSLAFLDMAAASRYRLSETIRQYGAERLAESGEADPVRRRHLAHFLALAEQVEPHLTGPEQSGWLARLDGEHDNLQAALAGCTDGEAEARLRLAGALWRFWWVRGYLGMGRANVEAALADEGAAGRTAFRAKALNGAGVLAWAHSDYSAATTLHEESLSIMREIGNAQGIAAALHGLGNVASYQGDYSAANSLHEEGLSIRRALGDKQGIAMSLLYLGIVARGRGDYSVAWRLYEESLAIQRELGDKSGIASSLGNLGLVACEQGAFGEGRALLEESLSIRRELGDRWGIASALGNLGSLACDQGDHEQARTLLGESLSIRKELGDKRVVASSLEGLATLALAEGQPGRATRLLSAAEALREAIGSAIPVSEGEQHDRDVTMARGALDEDVFTAAWAEGRGMTMEQAIVLALTERVTEGSVCAGKSHQTRHPEGVFPGGGRPD